MGELLINSMNCQQIVEHCIFNLHSHTMMHTDAINEVALSSRHSHQS